MRQASNGRRVADFCHVSGAPAFVSQMPRKGEAAAVQMKSDASMSKSPTAQPREKALVVAVSLCDDVDRDVWIGHRPLANMPPHQTGVSAYPDRRGSVHARCRTSPHPIQFRFSRTSLDEIADDAGMPRVVDLHIHTGIAADDFVVRSLGQALLPAFEQPEHVNRLFIDHVLFALGAHLVQAYGGNNARSVPVRGGLAPWQTRRAKDYLDANLDGDVSVTTLAEACGLSSTHFSRAFHRTTGASPHQWLLQRRIDKARRLLRDPDAPLADVALNCGFANQSHFTRVFTRLIGVSPGQWRRMNR
jgi:AraC family transcriptional regulator